MKVVILIPVYKRPEVLKLCLKSLALFIQRVSWEIQVVCLLSPEDKYLKENEKRVKSHGFKAIYFKNLPVSDKMNAGIAWIYKNLRFDYLMNFGSDDLIHPKIEALYEPFVQKTTPLFGVNSLYFHELNEKKTLFFHTYNFTGSIGAGRMIHFSVIDRIMKEKVPIYEPGLDSGLDTSSAMMIKRMTGVVDVGIECGTFPYIVDIKTTTNINPMFVIEIRAKNITEVDNKFLKKYYDVF